MGYHKNQLIAYQVEVGDRVPEPKPATRHVAFPNRRLRRNAERLNRQRMRDLNRQLIVQAAGYTLIGTALGIFVGVVICVSQ
jgi:hypothetical protein